MSAFRVKLGSNDLKCVDVPLNPAHSLTHSGGAVLLDDVHDASRHAGDSTNS